MKKEDKVKKDETHAHTQNYLLIANTHTKTHSSLTVVDLVCVCVLNVDILGLPTTITTSISNVGSHTRAEQRLQ